MRRLVGPQRLALVAIALAAMVHAFGAGATVVVPLSRAQLVERSDFVVRASVVSQHSEWSPDRSQIVTLTRLRVATYYKGSGPQELTVRQFGGTVDGITSRVPGDGRLSQGQDVVLFLRRGEGVVFLTALAQAVYHVVHTPGEQPTVRRDLHELTFARLENGQTVTYQPPAEPAETLDHLVREIVALAGGAR